MKNKNKILYKLWINESYVYFLISQGLMSLGETFRLVAITTIIVKATGSGLAAGFGLICSSLPSLLFSLLAGTLGDRFNEKRLMIGIDLFRCFILLLLIQNTKTEAIYVYLLILSSLEAFYYPSRNKLISAILDKGNLITGNSILSGCNGIAYIIGPSLAGLILTVFSEKTAFFINSITFLLSAALLSNVKVRTGVIDRRMTGRSHRNVKYNFFKDIREVFSYCCCSKEIIWIISVFAFISFGTISINTAFYSLAFDVYKVTGRGWGAMLSVFYGTSVIAMLISVRFKNFFEKHLLSLVKVLLLVISSAWFFYSITKSFLNVLAIQLIEGTAMSLVTICLNTRLQIASGKSFVARVMSINDLSSNMGKLLGLCNTFFIARIFSNGYIFISNSAILLAFTFYMILSLNTFYRHKIS